MEYNQEFFSCKKFQIINTKLFPGKSFSLKLIFEEIEKSLRFWGLFQQSKHQRHKPLQMQLLLMPISFHLNIGAPFEIRQADHLS